MTFHRFKKYSYFLSINYGTRHSSGPPTRDQVGSQPCRSVSQGVGFKCCLPKTACLRLKQDHILITKFQYVVESLFISQVLKFFQLRRITNIFLLPPPIKPYNLHLEFKSFTHLSLLITIIFKPANDPNLFYQYFFFLEYRCILK